MAEHEDASRRTLAWLARGEIELVGRVVTSWNHIFVARVDDGERRGLAIYKPRAGEYPLWDFSHGTLSLREAAAYRLSRALGWPLIPPTVLREGPYGFGMLQQLIEADPEITYFSLREDRLPDLLPVALFDHVVNNADRKGGHLLLDAEGRIWAIDHALTFNVDPKLRTVIWDFAGRSIPAPYLKDLERTRGQLEPGQPLQKEFAQLLNSAEMDALRERLEQLLTARHFPHPDPNRAHLPWPLI